MKVSELIQSLQEFSGDLDVKIIDDWWADYEILEIEYSFVSSNRILMRIRERKG